MMELRSNRSRSRSHTSLEKDIIRGNHIELDQAVVRTTRSKTIKTLTSDSDVVTTVSHNLEGSSKVLKRNDKGVRKSRYKTSDYSSEEGEYQVSTSETLDQNSKNRVIENLRRSVGRDSGVSALDFYRAAGDYWNKFPKTDYTYSPHSRDRTEIAPGVMAMPNMSRKSLRGYETGEYNVTSDKQTNTEAYLRENVDYSNSTLRSTSHFNSENVARVRPRNIFNNNAEDRYYSVSKTSVKKESLSRRTALAIVRVFVSIFSLFSYLTRSAYKTQNSWIVWVGKKIHQATTHILLWDTWLLQSSRAKRKISLLLILCLLPLLLLGGWWLLSALGPLLSGVYSNISSLKAPPIVVFKSDDDNAIRPFQSTENKLEEKIVTIREKVIVEHPKPGEIAAQLTDEQLRIIADSVKNSINLEERYNVDAIISKIVQDPSIQNIIHNYNTISIREKRDQHEELHDNDILQKQQQIINNLKEEIDTMKQEIHKLELNQQDEISSVLARIKLENAENTAHLKYHLNRCCRRSLIQMENYITGILKDLLRAPQYLKTSEDISSWLRSTFVARQDLERHLSNVTQNLQAEFRDLSENAEQVIMEKVASRITEELNKRVAMLKLQHPSADLKLGSLTEERIKKIVEDSIAVYDADKTGLVDYALESAGGHILSTRCTESYQARTAVLSIFGIPLWYPTNTPRTVITPGMTPGECWAFQNFPGFLLVKLAARIQIEAFSMEHISRSLVPNGKIDSAPKEFSVYGLRNETDKEPVLLGEYVYDYYGLPLQYFAAQAYGLVFDTIELRIHSNHGNPNYTCLYRFRVHGKLITEHT